ncbi:uncharacterized protein LOC135844060 [Planococcus citri]|uniref:uncharacterized protein LOC135844060 n=1 Tax=Planococcus citri TaxID=170843 RepID=UPI0031FA43AA
MESRHLQEPLPVFHLSPRTLQEMAATKCAFICWRNVVITKNIDSDKIQGADWFWEHSSFNCADVAPFPVGVRSLINHKMRLIGKEHKNWYGDHPCLKLHPGVIVNCFVLNPAGDICYKRTAKNLLTANPPLSLMEQFEIACKYCFEEDVERLWVLSKNNNHNFDDPSKGFGVVSLDLDYVGAMDYWCSKMRGELREFYKKANEEQERSPEWFVLSNHWRTNITNWAQVEYFWNKLNREERISFVRVSTLLLDPKFTKHLILKLDDVMLGNFTTSELNSVFEILAQDELCDEYALQLWSYVNVKKLIVEDKSTFYETWLSLSEMAFESSNNYWCHISHISSLLKEMWLSASIDFKNYVLSDPSRFEILFKRSLVCVGIGSFGRDVGFFIELLSDVSFEIRQHIWQSYWRNFFLLARVSDILELMTLCFDNADDIVRFKKNSMLDYDELRDIFTEFIEGELFDELIDYLKFCCSDDVDEKFVSEVRRNLALEYFDRITNCDSDTVFCKFLQFFYDSVSSADLAEVLNWEFQDKEANLLFMCILCDNGGLSIFTKALRYFEFPDQRVIELKRFFYERCQHVLMSGDFNSFFVQDWEDFLLWCTSSVEIVNRLRHSLAIRDLFDHFLVSMHKLFADCRDTPVVKCRNSYWSVSFLSIDGLLRWYFRDSKGVVIANAKNFKYDRLMDYENSEAIKMLLNLENDEILRDILVWFTDNNSYKLINFLWSNLAVETVLGRRFLKKIFEKNNFE